MNTPNPLVPQGSLQQSKGKSNVRIAIFTILAIHVVLLCGLLIQGCGKRTETVQPPPEETNNVAPVLEPMMTNETVLEPTNFPPIDTNIPVQPSGVPATTGAVSTPQLPTPALPVEPVAPTPTAETKIHVVSKGESLSTIAQKEHVTLKALQQANPSVDPTKLQIGQKLNVPVSGGTTSATSGTAEVSTGESSIYVVKSGDALEKIAKNHNTTVKAIKALNGMKTDRINVGQKLKMPATATAAEPSATSTTNR